MSTSLQCLAEIPCCRVVVLDRRPQRVSTRQLDSPSAMLRYAELVAASGGLRPAVGAHFRVVGSIDVASMSRDRRMLPLRACTSLSTQSVLPRPFTRTAGDRTGSAGALAMRQRADAKTSLSQTTTCVGPLSHAKLHASRFPSCSALPRACSETLFSLECRLCHRPNQRMQW